MPDSKPTLDRRNLPYVPNTMLHTTMTVSGEPEVFGASPVMIISGLKEHDGIELTLRQRGPGGLDVWHDVRLSPDLARGLVTSLQEMLKEIGEEEGEYRVSMMRPETG